MRIMILAATCSFVVYLGAPLIGALIKRFNIVKLEKHYQTMCENKRHELKSLREGPRIIMVKYIILGNIVYSTMIAAMGLLLMFPGVLWLIYNRFTIGYIGYSQYREMTWVKLLFDLLEAPLIILASSVGITFGYEEWKWLLGQSVNLNNFQFVSHMIPILIISLILTVIGGWGEGYYFLPKMDAKRDLNG